jgi:hypothetical protein
MGGTKGVELKTVRMAWSSYGVLLIALVISLITSSPLWVAAELELAFKDVLIQSVNVAPHALERDVDRILGKDLLGLEHRGFHGFCPLSGSVPGTVMEQMYWTI